MKTLTASKVASRKPQRVLKAWADKEPIYECRIREERKALGLTLRDVCNATGIDVASLYRAELGLELHLSKALKLAAFYEKPIAELWRRK